MRWKNFKDSELACKCCNINKVTDEAGNKLQELRDLFGPVYLSSAYRCHKYNKSIQGGSTHPRGIAFDIKISGLSGSEKHKLLKLGMGLFMGIGVYDKHFHFDLRETKSFWSGVSK